MDKRHVLFVALLSMLSLRPAHPVDAFFVVQIDVPDEVAITRWCKRLNDLKADFTSPGGTRLLQTGRQQCDAFHRGKINGQQWAERLIQLKRDASPQSVLGTELRDFPDVRLVPINYPIYTMMLFPDASWKTNKDLPSVQASFAKFGESIGKEGAAIWFLDRGNVIDLERAQFYCDRLGLSRTGPYILVSRKRPDAIINKSDVVVINCAGIDPDRLSKVLEVLRGDIVERRELRTRDLLFVEVKQWLLSEAERHSLNVFGVTTSLLKQVAK